MESREADGAAHASTRSTNVAPHDFDGERPFVTFEKDGVSQRLDCDFIAGCDGYHGVSRQSVPQDALKTFEKVYPFGWLGMLAEVPPADQELDLRQSSRAASRCARCARMPAAATTSSAPPTRRSRTGRDDRFWDELRRRLPPQVARGR